MTNSQYNSQLAKKYTEEKQKFSITDQYVFSKIKQLDLVGANVLDLGCGDGRYSDFFKELGVKK